MTSERQQGSQSLRRRALKSTFNPATVLGLGISIIYSVKTYNDLMALHATVLAWVVVGVGVLTVVALVSILYSRHHRAYAEQDQIRERLIRMGTDPDKLDD